MATESQAPADERAVDALFAGRNPGARAVYDALIETLRDLGEIGVEPKKSSIHLTAGAGTSAFAGVHPRKNGIVLNVRTDAPLAGPRIRQTEQVSKNRYHSEALLLAPSDIDDELRRWLAEAYQLARR
jgi:hypothetical protein